MKRIGTIFLLAGLFCASFLIVSPSSAQAAKKITVSFANGMSPNHAVNVAFLNFVKKLEERTGGQMTGVLYPNNQLGGDSVAIQAVQDHSLVMTWTTTATVVSFVPEMTVFDIPFFFPSIDAANKALADERLMKPIQDRFKKVGLYNLGLDAQGYRWMSSGKNKRVSKMEDLKGFKIRTMENPVHVAFWKALGAAPTPLANSERYTALQQGTVDGQENYMENAFNTKMHEVQDAFYNTKHIVYIGSYVGDPQWLDSLTPEFRKIFFECLAEFRKETVQLSASREADLLKELETKYKKTIVRELAPGEFERWQKAARPVAEELVRKKVGNQLVDVLYDVTGQKR